MVIPNGKVDWENTKERQKQEDQWMLKLRTVYPYGLNDSLNFPSKDAIMNLSAEVFLLLLENFLVLTIEHSIKPLNLIIKYSLLSFVIFLYIISIKLPTLSLQYVEERTQVSSSGYKSCYFEQ